ncbi:MAG TPA: hypothetical protein VER35_00085 [Candidatus Limnocylindrales bacterium]|nr:hypothetical protein [Candidatus Limnocylindrales bacterium]
MWKISLNNNVKSIVRSKKNFFISLIMSSAIIVILISILPVFAGPGSGYTNTTNKCISCHNDTGYPTDTDLDGVAAPYKRPHNNNTWCESCHGADPHTIKFIQPNGIYGSKSTAASCPACHQTGIPSEVNSNFTQAFKIPVTLKHSSDPSNGSVWGSYWNNADPKTACYYCHNKTLHDIFPLGRILEWSPGYVINGSIGSNYTCAGCHYKGSSDYSEMNSSFASASLPIPPEITNGSNWNGTTGKYFNHSLDDYTDNGCKPCHGGSLSGDARMSEFLHSVDYADMKNCLGCHRPNGAGPEVNATDLGNHTNVNLTGGSGVLTSEDCRMCHYSDPHAGPNASNTYYCIDCHNATGFNGSVRAPAELRFNANKHGVNQCVECHLADSKYHRGNPRGSVANFTYVNRYNTTRTYTDCGDCHYSANLDDAPFNAPGGGGHVKSNGDGACATGGGASCHNGGPTMVATMHKLSPKNGSNKPAVTIPTLNSPTVAKGSDVMVNTTVTVSSLYEFVDGAQYRIMSGTTEIQSWTSMQAVDGNFNATNEAATSTIKTSNLNSGNYNIEVRGMAGGPAQNPLIRYYPINGDISTTKSTTLTVELQNGYINGTITNGSSNVSDAIVSTMGTSTTSDIDGRYSLKVPPGTYNVTASKHPTHNDNTVYSVPVTALNTTIVNITLEIKPTGTISGLVTNV